MAEQATKEDLAALATEFKAALALKMGELKAEITAEMSQTDSSGSQTDSSESDALASLRQENEQLKGKLTVFEKQHPPGLCQTDECQSCRDERNKVTLTTVNKIEERLPGTREKLAHWELMNSKLAIVE